MVHGAGCHSDHRLLRTKIIVGKKDISEESMQEEMGCFKFSG